MKSGNLNFLEASGLLQTCNGTSLPLPSDSLFTCHPKTRHCVSRASEIVVKLTVNTNVGVWEKFKFHPLDCFTGGCRGKRTLVIVEQKNSLGQQISALVTNRLFQMC